MARIAINEGGETPRYQQIVESISRDIRSGLLPAGYRLPTVRTLARECGASQGTVKHAYDMLEQLGLIEKTQGRGTFVCNPQKEYATGKKEQALEAIDRLLDQMQSMDFTMQEIRIFLDLKLREREQMLRHVRVGAVDCSPEALAVMCKQISSIPHVDVYEYLLSDVLEFPNRFNPGLDFIVTTPTHSAELSDKMHPDQEPVRLVMALATRTALELARIPSGAKVLVLCKSERFSSIILRACEQCCALEQPPIVAFFGSIENTDHLLTQTDFIILPPQYWSFCSQKEQALLAEFTAKHPSIVYQYQIERGSLLFLEEQIEKTFRLYQNQE